jgi:ribose 5-phosphate isomerase A
MKEKKVAISDIGKQSAARAAITHIPEGSVVGIGTGSTVEFFIAALSGIKGRIRGAVSSSRASTRLLRSHGIPVMDLNSVEDLPVYVDGADEVTRQRAMIKGGGGALTGEKIVGATARTFICIADTTKLVDVLGTAPVPVEVIPLARAYVAREIRKLGGRPEWRREFTTDYGNDILDVHGLVIPDPPEMETVLNQISGVVTNGIFARRPADVVILGNDHGVDLLTPS